MASPPFYSTANSKPNTLVLVDIKDDIETFLGGFERCCSGRAKLTDTPQLASFYALLVFGVAKSILVDAYSIRRDCEEDNPWKSTDAAAISSAYKALVSCFCWSSKTDIFVVADVSGNRSQISAAVSATRSMIHTDRWEESGCKGTKDFLLSLGPSITPQGNYNCFLVQSFGLSDLPKTDAKFGKEPNAIAIELPNLSSNSSGIVTHSNDGIDENLLPPTRNEAGSGGHPSSPPISPSHQLVSIPEDNHLEPHTTSVCATPSVI
jgi:hypothetical protein